MTPFAALDMSMIKAAAFQYAPTYLPGRVPIAPTPAAEGGSEGAGAAPGLIKQPGVIENEWGDLAMSSIPVVGSAYMANKAIGDFRNGNIGSGLGNLLWAGVSLIPGVGLIRGGANALKGAKGLSALNKAKNVTGGAVRGAAAASPGWKPTVGVMGASMAAPMLLDPTQPQPQPMPQQPMQPYPYPQMPQQSPLDFTDRAIAALKGQ